VTFIPISALHGDNVVEPGERMDWYHGPPLLHHLEHVPIAPNRELAALRYAVQWVIPSNGSEHHDYRGYAGQLASGVLRRGTEVVVLPGGQRTRIKAIDTFDGEREFAFAPMSVALRVEDELDIVRGDMIVEADNRPAPSRNFEAVVCWMSEQQLRPGARYAIKQTTRSAKAIIEGVAFRVDVSTLATEPAPQLTMNDIGRVRLRASVPLIIDPYARNRATGSFILIDEATGETVAAGMVVTGGRQPHLGRA
jgi:bifunctional enzyme CysN/CysC/sulfate adenylyltransferase subunit 1